MPRLAAGLLSTLLLTLTGAARAGAIYPIDRAAVLAGSHFDLKVEFDQVVPRDRDPGDGRRASGRGGIRTAGAVARA